MLEVRSEEERVFTDAVRLTDAFPAVPLETYPAVVTLGVTDTVFDSVNVLVPVDTVALDPEIVEGAVTVTFAVA